MSAAAGSMPDPSAIEEFAGDPRTLDLATLVARDRPLLIRGLVREWPLVRHARESASAFAKALAAMDSGVDVDTLRLPPEADGHIGYSPAMDGFNYRHFRVPLTQGLQRLAGYSQVEKPPGLAIQSAAIDHCIPVFRQEHALNLLGGFVQPRLWVGNRVTTPTHFDAQHNIACVVCGRRRFTLFPPEQLPNLYIGPLDYAPTGAAISMARLDQADDPRFPRLRTALAAAQTATLEPGDAIYMPPLWWHNVASLEQLNALVNYWWPSLSGAGCDPGDSLDALFHCLLAFRELPAAERAHWRDLLGHYVFGEGDPVAHVPEHRRGVLGKPLTPEQLTWLRKAAGRHL
ncbi:MAG TPA: cupin-like domain-containing protein [Oleiagrimonas sp.]|nr:cupin-like domain-containing protein [Oleiagrimonas sp.]